MRPTSRSWQVSVLVLSFNVLCPSMLHDYISHRLPDTCILTTVMSHVTGLPPCQGTRVRPSGRLPSSLVRPVGSLEAGMPAEDSDRKIMSFMTLCLTILLGACLQIRPCCPLNIQRGSTSASMSHADAATKTQEDHYTDSVTVG